MLPLTPIKLSVKAVEDIATKNVEARAFSFARSGMQAIVENR